jgi:hypothetical protein
MSRSCSDPLSTTRRLPRGGHARAGPAAPTDSTEASVAHRDAASDVFLRMNAHSETNSDLHQTRDGTPLVSAAAHWGIQCSSRVSERGQIQDLDDKARPSPTRQE